MIRPILCLCLLALSGCGARSAPERSLDQEAAREALTVALESWKAGDPHDAPARRTRPIRVADEDWLAGTRLDDFRIEPEEWVIGANLHCAVALTLSDAQGRPRSQRVVYAIGTDPTPSIIRQDVP